MAGVPGSVLLFVLPFVVGAVVRRSWVVVAVFGLVLATSLLPDRTVVTTTANSVTYTTTTTDFAPTAFFALVAAMAAYMGASIGYQLRRLG